MQQQTLFSEKFRGKQLHNIIKNKNFKENLTFYIIQKQNNSEVHVQQLISNPPWLKGMKPTTVSTLLLYIYQGGGEYISSLKADNCNGPSPYRHLSLSLSSSLMPLFKLCAVTRGGGGTNPCSP